MRVTRFTSGNRKDRQRNGGQQGVHATCVCRVFVLVVLALVLLGLRQLWPLTQLRSRAQYYGDNERDAYAEEVRAIVAKDVPGATCYDIARRQPQPYTAKYYNQTIDLDGPVYAYTLWEGKTTKQSIDKWQLEIQRNTTWLDCRMIMKVVDKKLYMHKGNYCYNKTQTDDADYAVSERFRISVQLILLVLEVFDIPDIDFVLTLGDGESPTYTDYPLPSLSYCVKVGPNNEQPGFAFPGYATYTAAMGERQVCPIDFFQECLRQRYPYEGRIRKAVWRGSTTGPPLNHPPDILKNRRISLAFLAQHMPELLDAGISAFVQVNDSDAELMELLNALAPKQSYLNIEDFNSYAAVIDIDGNAWSDRLSRLLVSNTPVLKQDSLWIQYFGHLLQDQEHVFFYKEDLSNLVEVLEEMFDDSNFSTQKVESSVQSMVNFAKEHVSHHGVIRAMAYSMVRIASYNTWPTEMEEGYEWIPPSKCCEENPSLPPELIEKMRSRT